MSRETSVLLAVNGTLMRGLELNGNLLAVGARFVREAKTVPEYRLYSIRDIHPAMLRAKAGGAAISLELWEIPAGGLAAILQSEPAGLAIGKVLLADGSEVPGVLGEPWLCEGAPEITRHGGWREYLSSSSNFRTRVEAMSHDHDHDHDHDGAGGSHLSEIELRVRAMESLLTEKGYVDPKALDELIETYETRIGPRNGAHVVAKAWSEPAFHEWLLKDATAAIASLGYMGRQGESLVVLENSPKVHNMVVCTLCSCYPWPVLGVPPFWYKSAPYRSRAVIDPRGVLRDFGVTLADDVDVRVWDSTAEVRYVVLPMRPAGTEGWSEERLAELVTRDSMIGTGFAESPAEAPR